MVMNSKTAAALNKALFRAVRKDWVRYFILKIITGFPRQRASIILMEGISGGAHRISSLTRELT
jgi:hypothetical protein